MRERREGGSVRERKQEESQSVFLTATALKKVKHRLVERMKESTADTLGLSRAVLVNGQWLCSVVEWAACRVACDEKLNPSVCQSLL